MSQPPPNFPPPPGFPPPGPPPQGSGSGRTLLWVSIVAVVAVLAVAAVLVVVLVTRGDDGDDDDKDRDARQDRSSTTTEATSATEDPTEASSATDEPTEASSSATPVDVTNAALAGQWYGRYRCAQGASAGRLRITAVEGSTSELTAVFRFGASTNNAGTPPGAYRLEGEVLNGIMTLRAGEWIEQPPGYISVDMIALITDPAPDVLDGEVNYAGCSTFHFERK